MREVGRTESGWLIEVSQEELEALQYIGFANRYLPDMSGILRLASEVVHIPGSLRRMADALDKEIQRSGVGEEENLR